MNVTIKLINDEIEYLKDTIKDYELEISKGGSLMPEHIENLKKESNTMKGDLVIHELNLKILNQFITGVH